MSDVTKSVQLYDLSRNETIYELSYASDVIYMEGDELEIPGTGAFKIVRRRWAISRKSIILVLILEPLA